MNDTVPYDTDTVLLGYTALYCTPLYYYAVLYCTPLYCTIPLRYTVLPTLSLVHASGAPLVLGPGMPMCHTNGRQVCRHTAPKKAVSARGVVRPGLGATEALGTVVFGCKQPGASHWGPVRYPHVLRAL